MIADAEYERAVVEERDYIRTGYRFAMRMRGLERDESSLAHPAMGNLALSEVSMRAIRNEVIPGSQMMTEWRTRHDSNV